MNVGSLVQALAGGYDLRKATRVTMAAANLPIAAESHCVYLVRHYCQ